MAHTSPIWQRLVNESSIPSLLAWDSISGRVERRYVGVVTGQSLTEPLNASLARVGPNDFERDALVPSSFEKKGAA